jgi:putative membrane protein
MDAAAEKQLPAVMAQPVSLATSTRHEAGRYGVGFAPYFLALAMWIGVVFLFALFHPVARRARHEAVHALRRTVTGLTLVGGAAAGQAIILWLVLTRLVGLRPENPLGLLAFMVLCAVAFAAILQFVHAALGNAGRVLAVALLVVQLVASGGTYPIETSPTAMRMIHPWLPITYALQALRHLVVGGSASAVQQATLYLSLIALASLIGTVVVTKLGREKTVATDMTLSSLPEYEIEDCLDEQHA